MKRYRYHIAAQYTTHGHAIDGGTKASNEADLRLVLTSLYGHDAATAAEVWEAAEDINERRTE